MVLIPLLPSLVQNILVYSVLHKDYRQEQVEVYLLFGLMLNIVGCLLVVMAAGSFSNE